MIKNKYLYLFFLLTVVSPLNAAGLPQLDVTKYTQQLFWLIINFTSLYLFLYFIVIPKFKKIKNLRKHKILHSIEEAVKIKSQIEKLNQKSIAIKKETLLKENIIHEQILDKVKILTQNKNTDMENIKAKELLYFEEKIKEKTNKFKYEMSNKSSDLKDIILEKLNLSNMRRM